MTRRQCWIAGAVAATVLQMAAPVDAQSLVEAARLARQARMRTTGAVRTYTQDDLTPSERLAGKQRRRATEAQYRALLESARKRERDLERQLRESRASQTRSGADVDTGTYEAEGPRHASHSTGDTEGGIPLAIAYGNTSGPLFYLGQPVRRSASGHRGGKARGGGKSYRGRNSPSGRDGRGGQGRRRAKSASSSRHRGDAAGPPASAPAQQAPARNAFAESSRPLNYVVPGIQVPRVRSRPTPPGR